MISEDEQEDCRRLPAHFTRYLRLYEVAHVKIANFQNHLTFLYACKRHGVLPFGLRLKSNFHDSYKNQKIINTANTKLLKEQIKWTRKKLNKIRKELDDVLFHIVQAKHPDENLFLTSISKKYNHIFNIKKESQRKKLKLLIKEKNDLDSISRNEERVKHREEFIKRSVVNISSRILSSEEESVLSLGLKFAKSPNIIDKLDIISTIETGILKLEPENIKKIRYELKHVLDKPIKNVNNLTHQEWNLIKNIKEDISIICLPADKGNSTVVMDKLEYVEKMTEIFTNKEYQQLSKDPTKKIEGDIGNILKKHVVELGKQTKTYLMPSYSKPPHAFGQPKVHKINVPMRPIISGRNSPNMKLSKFLLNCIKPLGKTMNYRIKDTIEFAEVIKNYKLQPEDRMYSFDVKDMYPSVPIEETIKIIENIIIKDPLILGENTLKTDTLIDLLKVCLNNNYFQFEEKFYFQNSGLPMGSCLSSILSDIFMANFEESFIEQSVLKPNVWCRYVDDVFIIWSHGDEKMEEFFNEANLRHPNIKFTIEREEEERINFLDFTIDRSNAILGTKVFRKATHTNQYINFRSNHSNIIKESTIKCLVNRARTHCSNDTNLNQELETIKEAFLMNGYPNRQISKVIKQCETPKIIKEEPINTISLEFFPNFSNHIRRILSKYQIRTTFKSSNTFKKFLMNTKPENLIQKSKNWVYGLECQCGDYYIGESKRPLEVREREHKCNIKNKKKEPWNITLPKSLIAEHTTDLNHEIDWNGTKKIFREENGMKRKFKEAAVMECLKKNNLGVISQGSLEVDSIWTDTFKDQIIKKFNNS